MRKADVPTSINEVFSRIMETGRFKNQDEMINELQMARSYFFKVRKKEHYLSDENARKLAELAELPIDYVLAMNNFERCKDEEAREAYKDIFLLIRHLRTKNQ